MQHRTGGLNALTRTQIERRERILGAVRDTLSSHGYDGLSMRELAERANVSPTTLYNLFGGKDALVLAALRDLLEHIADRVAQSGTTGIQRLLVGAEEIGKQIVATPEYAEGMTRTLFNADPTDPICELLLADGIKSNRSALVKMQALGEVRRRIDVDAFARDLTGRGWMVILLWMKGFVALRDMPSELKRSIVVALASVMTPKLARRMRTEFRVLVPVAKAS
jgi:AcrR family transcriptional regulator